MRPVAVLFVSLLSLVCGAMQATIKLGISNGRVFPAPLGAAVFDIDRSQSYVALSEALAGEMGQYAVSMVGAGDEFYQGITPEKIRIGAQYDQDNPLFGKKISLLTLVDHAPLVVVDDTPDRVYTIRNPGTSSLFLLSSPILKLDTGDDCTRVVGLAGFPSKGAFFAALQGDQPFGSDDSTIMVGAVGVDEEQKTIVVKQTNTALVNRSLEALRINEDLQLIEPEVAFGINEHFQTCYTGLRVKSADQVGAGARAVFIGLDIPIAPAEAIENDSIVATNEQDKSVRIYHLSSMWTTTGLDYLIVVGGVEDAEGDKKRSVSALPLVGFGNKFASLARQDSEIYTLVNQYNPKQVVGRAFYEPAIEAGHIPASDSPAVVVGGTGQLPGDIEHLLVVKDTVFVAVASDGAVHGGLFASTALFDKEGRIIAWTDWAPAGGVSTKAVAGFLDQANGLWYSMRGETWNEVTTVERTQWQESSWGISLNEVFGEDAHGVQCVVDFPRNHLAFSQDDDNRTSLVCLGGNGKVALVQSGYTDADDCFQALTSVGVIEKNSTANNGADAYLWDSGVIADLGPIITADIVWNTTDGLSWLVVGGSNGAAVLCQPDGNGWETGELGSGFAGLPENLVWKKIYSGGAVRKICGIADSFFVLTEDSLYRFPATTDMFLGRASGVLLARSDSFGIQYPEVHFSDFFVSNQLALLATDSGLWRSGNGKDIRSAQNAFSAAWTMVTLPENMHSVTRFYSVSVDHLPSTMLGRDGGNVLVLNASVGRHGSNVYRFAIKPVAPGEFVSDDTVSLLPDCFSVEWTREEVSQEPFRTYFVSRGDYRNCVATDGSLWLFTRSAYAPTNAPAFVETLPPRYRTMSTTGASESRAIWVGYAGSAMGPLCLRSSDGSWLVGGSRLYGQN